MTAVLYCDWLKFIYFEKATKFCEMFPLLLTVCIVVKSKQKISQNVVAFSEYMNFNSLYSQHTMISFEFEYFLPYSFKRLALCTGCKSWKFPSFPPYHPTRNESFWQIRNSTWRSTDARKCKTFFTREVANDFSTIDGHVWIGIGNSAYRIVASRSMCYYSENQKFAFLKSRLLTCCIFL